MGEEAQERRERRLKGLRWHFAGYFVAMLIAVPLNLVLLPERPLFLLPMIGWGSVLAIHTAFVMGLFGR